MLGGTTVTVTGRNFNSIAIVSFVEVDDQRIPTGVEMPCTRESDAPLAVSNDTTVTYATQACPHVVILAVPLVPSMFRMYQGSLA